MASGVAGNAALGTKKRGRDKETGTRTVYSLAVRPFVPAGEQSTNDSGRSGESNGEIGKRLRAGSSQVGEMGPIETDRPSKRGLLGGAKMRKFPIPWEVLCTVILKFAKNLDFAMNRVA